jgi:murein DD-endopeptidase MepM/ murein hydrolase activator NlpD
LLRTALVGLRLLSVLTDQSTSCDDWLLLQAEALNAKQQLEDELEVARVAVAALKVDWSKFVEKGVEALPLPKKAKKAAAARAKKIAATAVATAELAAQQQEHEQQLQAVVVEQQAAAAETQPSNANVHAAAAPASPEATGGSTADRQAAGERSPDLLDPKAERAISGVLSK